MLNEKDVIDTLEKFGFKTVYTEDFSFNEQVKIFQNAEFIVAPNGSALNNLIFCSSKVKVLMLGQKNLLDSNWGGWFGSFMELGYSINYLAGHTIGSEEIKHSDYIVPVAAVEAKVKELLSS
jgi:capsular polysaccharide biosynthesis protein